MIFFSKNALFEIFESMFEKTIKLQKHIRKYVTFKKSVNGRYDKLTKYVLGNKSSFKDEIEFTAILSTAK